MQSSSWSSPVPVIAQSAFAGLIDHVTPFGSGSFSVTPFAVPGPLFVVVIVNPIALPALTDASSAVFTTSRSGASQVTVASSLASGWLVDVAVASLS